jgi:glycine/D-amino acid oxidase-like deaminating enzyme
MSERVLICGAGVFGLEASLVLRARGWDVQVIDEGPLPHPLAASTDLSKAVRMDYGDDDRYADAMLECLSRWRGRNATWGDALFHETGVTYLSREPLREGGFEHESFTRLRARGVAAERLDGEQIHRRFSGWREGYHRDGYFNPIGGWVESGRLVEALVTKARGAGVTVTEGAAAVSLIERGGRVLGARSADGRSFEASLTVCAMGAWTPSLVPALRESVRATGHPVFLLRPSVDVAQRFAAPAFVTWGSDIARTGWYGFPLHPREGLVKIAHHGAGRVIDPATDARLVTESQIAAMRAFVRDAMPALADAPLERTRLCTYADTDDGHFVIDRDPTRAGLLVATGDSGHALKFAPMLGEWIADACEGRDNEFNERFRWRNGVASRRGESARSWCEH